jgi:DNA-binding MarR family transcriptional regulator
MPCHRCRIIDVMSLIRAQAMPVNGAEGDDVPGKTERPRQAGHDELRYLILAAQREGSRRLGEALRHLDLTPAQAEVLDVLSASPPLTLAALGRLLVCEAGSPSRLVDSLVRRGLVDRTPHGSDKRAVLIALTATGRDLAGRLDTATAELTTEMAARLPEGDRQNLIKLLHLLLHNTHSGNAIRSRFPGVGADSVDP